MKKSILLIGYPGIVAEQVSVALCRDGRSVCLLVSEDAMKRARTLKKTAGDNLQIIAAEPYFLDFGLSGKDYTELAARTGTVLSLLPSTPGPTDTPPGRLSMIGREIVEFCLTAGDDVRLIHLSSIDVRGDFSHRFAERDLDVGQGFYLGSPQERFRNERVLSRFSESIRACVIRAGMIVGDGDGLFPLIPIMLAESAFFGRYDNSHLYLTPLDGLTALVVWLVDQPEVANGNTFHFFTESPMSPRHLSSYLGALAGETLPSGVDPSSLARRIHAATGFTARTFWQHNSSTDGADSAWTSAILSRHRFPVDEILSLDWHRLVGQAVEAMMAQDSRKGRS